jgi:putative ABC transport system ATP-binding protein
MAELPQYAVRCSGLKKHYGAGTAQVAALRGASLEASFGELLMLVGPSGCGKTTLISIIAAILDQDAGTCEVLGRDIAAMPARERIHFRGRAIGFVFQSFNLLPALTVAENVAVPLIIQGVARAGALARAREVLEGVGLAGRADAPVTNLSGGQKQRVAIARAMVHEPRLIICDEPTSSLDHDAGQQVMALLREVALRPERAVLVVTHDARIYDFADRVARMDDGAIVEVTARAGVHA